MIIYYQILYRSRFPKIDTKIAGEDNQFTRCYA